MTVQFGNEQYNSIATILSVSRSFVVALLHAARRPVLIGVFVMTKTIFHRARRVGLETTVRHGTVRSWVVTVAIAEQAIVLIKARANSRVVFATGLFARRHRAQGPEIGIVLTAAVANLRLRLTVPINWNIRLLINSTRCLRDGKQKQRLAKQIKTNSEKCNLIPFLFAFFLFITENSFVARRFPKMDEEPEDAVSKIIKERVQFDDLRQRVKKKQSQKVFFFFK